MISWNLWSSPPIPSPSMFHCLQGPQHLGDPSGSHHPSWVAAPAPLWLHTCADRGAAHAWRRAAVREPRARPCCGTLEIWRAEVWMMKIYLVIWHIYIHMYYICFYKNTNIHMYYFYIYTCLSNFVFIFVCVSGCLSGWLAVCLFVSIYLSIYLFIYLSIDLCIYRSIYLPRYLPGYLFVLCIYLSNLS